MIPKKSKYKNVNIFEQKPYKYSYVAILPFSKQRSGSGGGGVGGYFIDFRNQSRS